jgi:hypothetical protein
MATLDDILTTQKNGVLGVNSIATSNYFLAGKASAPALSTTSLVRSGAGWVAKVSVTTAGSTSAIIYDSNATTILTTPIAVIANTVGVVTINLPVTNGIVFVPGTGMTATVSYS